MIPHLSSKNKNDLSVAVIATGKSNYRIHILRAAALDEKKKNYFSWTLDYKTNVAAAKAIDPTWTF